MEGDSKMIRKTFVILAFGLIALAFNATLSHAGYPFDRASILPDRLVFLPDTCVSNPVFSRCYDVN
jgi:hypothetical protein